MTFENPMTTFLFCIMMGYLLGSIPSGYLAGRWLADIDLRQIGSGSTGATNVLRQVGKGPAIAVFLIDVCKGSAAVLITRVLLLEEPLQIAAGLSALAGHIWPIWLNWKGGKAVATGFGMLLGLSWIVGLSCFGIFLTVFSFSKIVSLSSVIAALSLPLLMIFHFHGNNFSLAYLLVSLAASIMVIWRHRSNLQRLKDGNEPRIGHNL